MADGNLTLDVDSARVAQALTNLLNNAAKYTDPGGKILLCAEATGRDLRVLVRDNGIGLDEAALSTVFEMFSQVEDAQSRSEGGLGIGLALTRGVVQLHGGQVAAKSAGPGRGSEFAVDIPGVVVADAPAPSQATPPSLRAGRALRILVADDNRDAAESLAMLLEMAGHRTRVVETGRAAVSAASEFAPDMAFLDIGMPDMDGCAAARAIRSSPEGRDIVLVAVTGWGQAEDRQRTAQAGFDAHLTKPVEPSKLDALLSQPLAELRNARKAIHELTDPD